MLKRIFMSCCQIWIFSEIKSCQVSCTPKRIYRAKNSYVDSLNYFFICQLSIKKCVDRTICELIFCFWKITVLIFLNSIHCKILEFPHFPSFKGWKHAVKVLHLLFLFFLHHVISWVSILTWGRGFPLYRFVFQKQVLWKYPGMEFSWTVFSFTLSQFSSC